ncbi:MAG: folylpolyglutamate synthase/dihydrofolate synthase family protein [Actinomycetota bacterium]
MNYAESIEFLNSRIRFGIRPGTERVAALVESMGHPERSYPVLHVSGTNGKFSVAAIATSILSELGMTVGTYTSPDLGIVRERIALAGEMINEELFASVLSYLQPYIEIIEAEREDQLTYFELLTVMAFEVFFDQAVHAAVIETGLGGEYDATNVADARVAVITNVTLDHVRQFGGDLHKAAWEKAGIAKKGSVVVTGVEQDDLYELIDERAREKGAAQVVRFGREFDVRDRQVAVGGQLLSLRGLHGEYDEIFLNLFGRQQARNAGLAVAACEALVSERLDPSVLAQGLGRVRAPGRVEVVGHKPLIVCDGGHNPAAAEVVKETVREAFAYEKLILVIGMLSEKLIDEVLEVWAPVVDSFVVTAPESSRAAEPDHLVRSLLDLGVPEERMATVPQVGGALEHAIQRASDEDLVLVFGSFYTVGEARAWLRSQGVLAQA